MRGVVPNPGCRRFFAILALTLLGLAFPNSARAGTNSLTASLAVGTNADGRLEVFEVDAKGDLRHRWQRESLHDWSAWSIIGSSFLPGIAVVNDERGRLAVFAVDRAAGSVMYNFQREPNSPAWLGWTNLPGRGFRAPLAAGRNTGGQLEVFAVDGHSGSVKHIWQNDNLEGWSDWQDMGGAFEPGLVVACNKSGELDLFATRANDHILNHCWEISSNSPGRWTAWASLGEPILPGFAAGQNTDGRLELVGVNATNGFVTHAFQLSASPDTAWSPWYSLGARMKPAITMQRNRDGRIEIFTVNPTNNMIYHVFQWRGGATTNWVRWTDMSLVGGLRSDQTGANRNQRMRRSVVGGSTRSDPVAGKGPEGDIEVFAFDERLDDVLNYRRQIPGSLLWTDWLGLDHATSQYLSRAWRTDDGLPDNRVQAITQTPDGYLWVGTPNGLARFDGAHFVIGNVNTMCGWTNPAVSSLCVDHDGFLWIGSEAEGLARSANGRASLYSTRNGLAGNKVTTIVEASDRSLWIGTATGLSHYQGGRVNNYTRSNGLLSDSIRSIVEDSTGAIWLATGRGLNRIKDGGITAYTRTNGMPDDSLSGVWQDVPGRLWIASDHGLIFFRGEPFYAYDKRYGQTDRLTTVIRNDSQGNLWVGNNSGLNVFKDGRFYDQLDQEGNSFGRINTLFFDREENLWAGSQDGLFRLTPKRLLLYGRKQQLTHDNISSVMEDVTGNRWIGTWGGGLDQLRNETVTSYDPANGFRFDLISALARSRDGSVWVSGSFGTGVVQLTRGIVTWQTGTDELTNTSVRVLHEDRSGALWIGTIKGLYCLKDYQFVTNNLTASLAGTEVRAICESPDGALWIGGGGGLFRSKDSHVASFTRRDGLSDNGVTALCAGAGNEIWIGTSNGGLNRFIDGRFRQYTAAKGLFSDEIYEILEDDFGWLWMTCSKGVFRVSKKDLDDFDLKRIPTITSIAYGHDDGMESVQCGNGKPGGWKSRDGMLWFPTANGLVAFDPRILKINQNPPPVYVEELVADQHSLPSTTDELRVPAGRGDLEFHYTAPSFGSPERVRFKYKLEGTDPEWIDAGTRRAAYYNHLSPGHYRFQVTACNSDGVWNRAGASLSFFVVPHYWQTAWFRLLAISAVTGIVAGTARQMTKRRMQRKLELLEHRHAIERERLRIARDIHDDLGGSLTQIALLGELAIGSLANPTQAARHLAKITDSARLNVRALDEIVWAVHPGNDNLNSLVLYLWQFAEEFFGPTNVRCRVEAPPNIPACPLPSDLRHTIFLVTKEAFNNTIKHARATEVRLRFAVTSSNFAVTIEDNGCGFSVAAVNGSGNGLNNMRRRVQEIGGTIELTSIPGRGTRIEFNLPLRIHHEVN